MRALPCRWRLRIAGAALVVVSAQAALAAGSIALSPPQVNAASVYLIELRSGRVLFERNATQRLPPASLTKLMVALVAMQEPHGADVIRVDRRAVGAPAPRLGIRADEAFRMSDLLAAMLITSANDACLAVVLHTAPDAVHFVARMNDRAAELGLTATHFVDACGFDAPGHYSTAVDLAHLAAEVLQHADLAMMVRTLRRDIADLDGEVRMSLQSTNRLLVDPHIVGVKTGYTGKAGRCLIVGKSVGGWMLLLVGLDVRGDRWQQALALLSYGEAKLHENLP